MTRIAASNAERTPSRSFGCWEFEAMPAARKGYGAQGGISRILMGAVGRSDQAATVRSYCTLVQPAGVRTVRHMVLHSIVFSCPNGTFTGRSRVCSSVGDRPSMGLVVAKNSLFIVVAYVQATLLRMFGLSRLDISYGRFNRFGASFKRIPVRGAV